MKRLQSELRPCTLKPRTVSCKHCPLFPSSKEAGDGEKITIIVSTRNGKQFLKLHELQWAHLA